MTKRDDNAGGPAIHAETYMSTHTARDSPDIDSLTDSVEHANPSLRLHDRSLRPRQGRRASIGNGEIPKLAKKGTSYIIDAGKSDAEILSCLNSIYSGIPTHETGLQIPQSRLPRADGLPDLMSRSHRSSISSNSTNTSFSTRQAGLFKRISPGRSLSDNLSRLRSRRASIGNGEIRNLARVIVPRDIELYSSSSDDEGSDASEASVARAQSNDMSDAEAKQASQERIPASTQSSGTIPYRERTNTSTKSIEKRPTLEQTSSQKSKTWYQPIQAFYQKNVKDKKGKSRESALGTASES